MTESDAMSKLCPLLKSNCMASSCMLWRLISPLTPEDGYCGLAPLPMNHHLNSTHHDSDE